MQAWSDFLNWAGPSLYWVVICGTILAQCLVAVWAAASSRPRWLRVLVALAAIGLLLPVGADWPALIFLLNSTVAFGIISVLRRRQPRATSETIDRPWRATFELGDLFALMLLVAIVFASARHLIPVGFSASSVLSLLLPGLTLGPVIAFSHLAVAGPARRHMVIATFLAICLSAPILILLDVGQALGSSTLARLSQFRKNYDHVVIIAMLLGGLLVTLSIALWCAVRLWVRPPAHWRVVYATLLSAAAAVGLLLITVVAKDMQWSGLPTLGKYLKLIAAIFLPLLALAAAVAAATWLAPLWRDRVRQSRHWRVSSFLAGGMLLAPSVWLYCQMLLPIRYPPPPASPVNHYYRIVAIARELSKMGPHYGNGRMTPRRQELLDEAVQLLAAPNFIPPEALESEPGQRPSIQRHLSALDVRDCLTELHSAAQCAAELQEFDRGANYALAAIRFDTLLQRGASLEFMAAFAPDQALQWLAYRRNDISPAAAREMIAEIERALAERESFSILQHRSNIYWNRATGWRGRLRNGLGDRTSNESMFIAYAQQEASLRALQVLLAVRLFHDDQGRLPADLGELVPRYLAAIPLDPHTQKPLTYRRLKPLKFELYSVGPDRVDNGGDFDPQLAHQGRQYDIDLSWSAKQRR